MENSASGKLRVLRRSIWGPNCTVSGSSHLGTYLNGDPILDAGFWILDGGFRRSLATASNTNHMEQTQAYKRLEVWQLARLVAVGVLKMSLTLPKFELYEEGSQIRRSAKSIRSNIVEGYGRRRYKQEFIRFLVYAQASCDETIDHLESLLEGQSLTDTKLYEELHALLLTLGKKLNLFIQAVEEKHLTTREHRATYGEIMNDFEHACAAGWDIKD